jgi:hypothetical protein
MAGPKPLLAAADIAQPQDFSLSRRRGWGPKTGTHEFFFETGQRAVRAAEILQRESYGYMLTHVADVDAELDGSVRKVEQYDLIRHQHGENQRKIGDVEIVRGGDGKVESVYVGMCDFESGAFIKRFIEFERLS